MKLITTDTTGEDVALNTNPVWIWAIGSISSQGDCVILQHSTGSGGTLNSSESVTLPCQSGLKLNTFIYEIFEHKEEKQDHNKNGCMKVIIDT